MFSRPATSAARTTFWPPDLNVRSTRGTSNGGMDLADTQRIALEAKVALLLDEYERITRARIAKVRQEAAARGMSGSGVEISHAWAIVADDGRNVMQGLVNECLAIGWRDEAAITDYVMTHHAAFLRAFRVADSPSADYLAETLASSQARGEGAARIPNLVRANIFEATKHDVARATSAAPPPAVAPPAPPLVVPQATAPKRHGAGVLMRSLNAHPVMIALMLFGGVIAAGGYVLDGYKWATKLLGW